MNLLAFLGIGSILSVVPPSFTDLHSDLGSYLNGQRAVLTVHLPIQPSNPMYGLALSARLNGAPFRLLRLTERMAGGVTPLLTSPGVQHWEVTVYLEEKMPVRSREAAIVFWAEEILLINQRLGIETDPEIRANLQAQRERDQRFIEDAQNQIGGFRRELVVSSYDFNVTALNLTQTETSSDPVLDLRTEGEGCDYAVGTRATFLSRVLTDFTGADGPRENILRATFDGIAAGIEAMNSRDFRTITSEFTTADVGLHDYEATLWVRSKARADRIREAISAAEQGRAQAIASRDATTDPYERAYWQRRIDDLSRILLEFGAQLEASLERVTSASKEIHVQ